MTYTIDRIKELVPEANLRIDGMDMDFKGKPFPRGWFQALLTARAEVERLSRNFDWLRKLDMSLCPEPNGGWSVLDSKNERAYFGKTPELAIAEARHALEKGE